MSHPDLYNALLRSMADLSEESLRELARFVSFLKWKETKQHERPDEQGPEAPASRSLEELAQGPATREACWVYDFIEHFDEATVTATQAPDGMEVRVAPAMCGLEQQMAIWQHPPVAGAAVVQYQFSVPGDVQRLRLLARVGIRNGSLIAESPDNYVAFRFLVDGVRLWSITKNTTTWEEVAVDLPSLAGEFVTVQFVTDGLGDNRWNWAVWGTPLLVGEKKVDE